MSCRKCFLFIPSLCLLFSVFFSFTLEKNSFATSVSCSGTTFSSTMPTLPCDFSTFDNSFDINIYFKLDVNFSSPTDPSYCQGYRSPYFMLKFGYNDSPNVYFSLPPVGFPTSSVSVISSFYHIRPSSGSAPSLSGFNYLFAPCYSIVSDWTLTATDDLSTFAGGSLPSGTLPITSNGQYDVTQYEYVDVNVANEVIQGDYHDDLVSIKHAIITCGGVILVLYFFYCIYRMIIKNSGVH